MSTTAEASGETGSVVDDFTAKQRRILGYLRAETDPGGCSYFKSRLVAADLDMTAKEVGVNMAALLRAETDVDVEKWGYSSGTTWKVCRPSAD